MRKCENKLRGKLFRRSSVDVCNLHSNNSSSKKYNNNNNNNNINDRSVI